MSLLYAMQIPNICSVATRRVELSVKREHDRTLGSQAKPYVSNPRETGDSIIEWKRKRSP